MIDRQTLLSVQTDDQLRAAIAYNEREYRRWQDALTLLQSQVATLNDFILRAKDELARRQKEVSLP